ncbi:MAG: hypothetical protein H6867_00210 [Rhodospirillales bacterium]|nr:hypothetical protein [Rhodospirillales bacterium]MCB9996918.1 hypothetical protein [Rhodospirillales bacterium]
MPRIAVYILFSFTLTALLLSALPGAARAQDYNPYIAPEQQAQDMGSKKADDVYNRLPPDIQAELMAEAEFVHNFCETQDMFSSLHDCRCVAAKFLDRRILDYNPLVDPLSLADQVAEECPNEAGAAGYGYKQCTGLYGWQMPYGLEEFCGCYGRHFAKLYMENPGSYMPKLTGIGSASALKCAKEIENNPLKPRLSTDQ